MTYKNFPLMWKWLSPYKMSYRGLFCSLIRCKAGTRCSKVKQIIVLAGIRMPLREGTGCLGQQLLKNMVQMMDGTNSPGFVCFVAAIPFPGASYIDSGPRPDSKHNTRRGLKKCLHISTPSFYPATSMRACLSQPAGGLRDTRKRLSHSSQGHPRPAVLEMTHQLMTYV